MHPLPALATNTSGSDHTAHQVPSQNYTERNSLRLHRNAFRVCALFCSSTKNQPSVRPSRTVHTLNASFTHPSRVFPAPFPISSVRTHQLQELLVHSHTVVRSCFCPSPTFSSANLINDILCIGPLHHHITVDVPASFDTRCLPRPAPVQNSASFPLSAPSISASGS